MALGKPELCQDVEPKKRGRPPKHFPASTEGGWRMSKKQKTEGSTSPPHPILKRAILARSFLRYRPRANPIGAFSVSCLLCSPPVVCSAASAVNDAFATAGAIGIFAVFAALGILAAVAAFTANAFVFAAAGSAIFLIAIAGIIIVINKSYRYNRSKKNAAA